MSQSLSRRAAPPRGRRSDAGEAFPVVAGAITVLVLLGAVVSAALPYTNGQTRVCTVTEKDRAAARSSSDMRVYTEECGVLRVRDLLFAGLTNSADLYGSIEPGETYLVDTSGYRIPLFSQFPVVRAVAEVSRG